MLVVYLCHEKTVVISICEMVRMQHSGQIHWIYFPLILGAKCWNSTCWLVNIKEITGVQSSKTVAIVSLGACWLPDPIQKTGFYLFKEPMESELSMFLNRPSFILTFLLKGRKTVSMWVWK